MDIFTQLETTEALASLNIKCQCIQQLGTKIFNSSNTKEDYQKMCQDLRQICEDYIDMIIKVKEAIPKQE